MKIKLPGSDTTKSVKSPINVLFAWVILLIALTLTFFYTYSTKRTVEENARKDFSFECNEIKSSVISKLHAHAAVLRTGAAFIEACDTVTRKEWEVFIANQRTDKNLPGVLGLGYTMIVSGNLLKSHEQHIRESGFPGYSIKPAGEREIYTSIIYIEPFSERNIKAFGYDMFSEPVRREAMEKARDYDIASLSGKVKLVQESNTDIQAGMLMYVPVYRSGMPIKTMNERRRAIKGWSYSPYRMNDFMLGVLGNYEHKLKGSIRMQIYDSDSIKPELLMFDSESAHKTKFAGPNMLSLKLPFVFNGKSWTLHFSKVMEFSSFYFYKDVLQVLFGGTVVSFLIFSLALLLLLNRYRLRLTTRLAQNLKESLDKHVALYNAIPDAVFVTDSKTGLIEDVNKMASDQYGYTNDEFKSLLSSTLSPMHGQPENSGIRDILYVHDTFHVKKDGTVFPVEITDSSFEIHEEKKIISIARDITARLNARLELTKSKERYQTLVENVSDAIVVTLPDKIAYANKRFFDFLGYPEQEVLSESYLNYIHPADKVELLKNYMKLFEGKSLHRYPARVIIKDGSIKWVEFSGIVIEWDGQNAVLSFIADITERKMAEDALHESEELYKSTINASPDDITVTDINGKILMVSPATLPLLGYDSTDEIIGRQLLEFLVPDDRERAISNIELLFTDKGLGPESYRCIKKDGGTFYGEINGEIIHDANGQPTGFVFIVRDVNERKRAEKELRESEEKWKSLVSNSPDFIALHDKEGKYLFLNHFAEGFSEKDILNHTVFEFIGAESKELFKLKVDECITTWKPVKFEHTALGNHGTMRIYEESFVPFLTKNEEVNILAVAKDITEKKQSELKLQEREEHFRLIFENGSIAMALVDANFRFTQVNKAFVSFLGYTETELTNMTFVDLTDPDYIEQDKVQVKRLLNHEIELYRTEKKYTTRYQKTVWGLVQVSVMYNKAGEFLSLLVMINNITERKRAEESLLESQEIFNQFMLNSPIYVFFKDKNIRSLRLSRNFEQMLGRPLNELLGKTMDELFPSDLAKKMVADDIRILNEGKQMDIEEEMNGRYYSTTKFPIFIEGKPMYLAGYTIDITSRKLAGDTIKAALNEKEILLREVHHRVKNNLQVVSSLLNLQSNKITDKSIKEILEQSRNRIRSIALVHEKLYQTGNFAEINIKEYTRSLVTELFRIYMADPQIIHIRTEIEDVNVPLVYAIPYGLILNEIISNSLKYAFPKDYSISGKPEIFITLKTLPDNYLQISAGDNGIGLPDDYQLTDSLSLGLYLIQILSTEQLDGEIEIDNKKGTIFTITFNPSAK